MPAPVPAPSKTRASAAAPSTAPLPDRSAAAPRLQRQQAVAEVRRGLVLEAARSAFFELGLEGASLREIARRAGYTPGALYSYYASKEEVYAALLGESLERLNAQVVAAAPASAEAAERLRAQATAFFDFYRENPRDLDLGFYLFHGMQPRGLTPALNERLNLRLRDALDPMAQALRALGLDADTARAETTALFAHAVGLLLLSHTGRIRMFAQDSADLFERYLSTLVARCPPVRPTAIAAAKPRAKPRISTRSNPPSKRPAP